MMRNNEKKVILIIKDGWGYRKEKRLNAVASANTPFSDFFEDNYPTTLLDASGPAVGVSSGFQGNSEIGHLTIGSGRIIKQNLVKINEAIEDGSFFKKKELLLAINNCRKNNSKLHILGLFQKEGVHAHLDHLYALLDLCKKENFKEVLIHVITDGRDSPVNRGKKYVAEVNKKIKKDNLGEIVTISGRYYAMDRDKRYERTRKAYRTIVLGKSKEYFNDPIEAISDSYKKGETDEFILPKTKKGYDGLQENDSFIFYNFRIDRPRQMTRAIIEEDFDGWERKKKNIFFVAMTDYYSDMRGLSVFKEEKVANYLGEVVSSAGLSQLRISETEKYAHVTFFLNGQKEEPLKREERILIPSPRVPFYDKTPKMSAELITKRVLEEIKKETFDLIVINFVNADMVSHTANVSAIKKAVEVVDKQVSIVVKEGEKHNYTSVIIADHGNAEDQRKEWRTSHTTNPVKLTVVNEDIKGKKIKRGGGLKDVAPTVLKIMGLKKPEEMTGRNLL